MLLIVVIVIIGALVGLPYCSARWANQNLSSELAGNIVSYLSAVASVLKITVLFIFKMGIYPICLGLIWHASELDRRVNTVATAPRGKNCDNKLEERLQKVDDGLAQQPELLKKHKKAEADRKPKSFLEKLLGE